MTRTWWRPAAALLGPVALTIAGITHPPHLTADSAGWWRDLHVVMLPLFPLLGLSVWVLVHGFRDGFDATIAWIARLLAFVYAMFYTGLDVLAGIGAGALTEHRSAGNEIGSANSVMFFQGNILAEVGTGALVASFALTGYLLLRRDGPLSLVGTAVCLAAAVSFITSHVYWPRGVITMAAFAIGVALLLWSESRAAASQRTSRRDVPHRTPTP